jgi:dethiobiotin synthetase
MSLPGLFVVGTDTGVGKTVVASAIAGLLVAQGHRVGVLKPVATGASRENGEWESDDGEALLDALAERAPRDRVVPLAFEPPLAPPVAARCAGETLAWEDVERATSDALQWWHSRADVMVVEGVGGLLCPLAEGATVADLAVSLDYPLVVVARRGLGTLNHTLLTVEAARLRGLRIAGVLLNGAEPTANPLAEATNRAELARRLEGVPVLAELPHEPDRRVLLDHLRPIDWYSRTGRPRLATRLGANGAPPTQEPTDHVQRDH